MSASAEKRSVFITGGANGIGEATARRFAAEGWFVGVYDVDMAGARRLSDELGWETARGGMLDVTNPTQWDYALKEFVAAAGGRLDLLINNAGILRAGRLADVPLTAHHATIDVNVNGVINGCHAAYPYLKETPGSGVINLCSASAIYGQPEIASYSASKFAVRGLTEALELEWRADGIRVQAVWPLWVKTALLEGNHATSTETMGVNLTVDDVATQILAMTRKPGLMGRIRTSPVHTAVGFPAKALATAADLVPSVISREINKWISKA
ncbi:MAG: SDR family oxidoreductase [Nocardioides sp.]|uniref:SDR family oxidoreductase n=1 Tax=Nocardioides sp. TaxID=35761 RepID=UPI0039E4DA28